MRCVHLVCLLLNIKHMNQLYYKHDMALATFKDDTWENIKCNCLQWTELKQDSNHDLSGLFYWVFLYCKNKYKSIPVCYVIKFSLIALCMLGENHTYGWFLTSVLFYSCSDAFQWRRFWLHCLARVKRGKNSCLVIDMQTMFVTCHMLYSTIMEGNFDLVFLSQSIIAVNKTNSYNIMQLEINNYWVWYW